ncbi:MAG: SMC family ATPase [Ruminococcus sp.]|nr:SMC family ATPase [Ruminococcus sp.]
MRPIKLEMAGFGSYIRPTVIEFDKLGNGVYLICGDTGAGKTTIFDAMTFALYGAPSGDNRSGESLRSKYALPSDETYVDFYFSVGKKEYRIKRNPAYTREKKRGGGLTEEAASAIITLPDGRQKSGIKTVNELVCEDILKVSRDEFTQISMIAQGEFLKLLTTKTEDRQHIFRILFKTGKYDKLRAALADKCSEMRGNVRELELLKKSLLGNVTVKTPTEQTDMLINGQLSDEETQQLLLSLTADDKELSGKLKSRVHAARNELQEVKKRLDSAKKLEEIQKSKNDAQAKKAEHEKKLEKTDEILKSISGNSERSKALLEEAAGIDSKIPQYTELDEKIKKADTLKRDIKALDDERVILVKQKDMNDKQKSALEERQTQLSDSSVLEKQAVNDLEKVRAENDDNKALAKRIEDLTSLKSECDEKRRSYKALESRISKTKELITELSKQRDELAKNKELKARLVEARLTLSHSIDDAEKQRREYSQLLDDIKASKEAAALYRMTQQDHKQKLAEADAAAGEYRAANRLYLSSIAGIMAQELEDDAPCPVCGSTHHPNKAHRPDGAPTEQQVEELLEVSNIHDKLAKECSELAAKQGGEAAALENKVKGSALRLLDKEYGSDEAQPLAEKRIAELDESIRYSEQELKNNDSRSKDIDRQTDLIAASITELERKTASLEKTEQELSRLFGEMSRLEGSLSQQKDETYAAMQRMLGIDDIAKAQTETAKRERELKNKADALEAEILKQRRGAQELERIKKELRDLSAISDKLTDNEKDLLSRLSAAKGQLDEVERTVKTLRDSLKYESLEKAREESAHLRKQAEGLTDALEKARNDRAQTERELAKIAGSLSELEASLKEYGDLDPEGDRQKGKALEKHIEELEADADKVRQRLLANERAGEGLAKNAAEMQAAQGELSQIRELSETASGSMAGLEKLSLEAYVQGEYFDNILARANERLMLMTDGQYSLKRAAADSIKSKTGLELDVLDHINDSKRSVKTLSGGESFMASLSLALGLSEEIQESAGGIRLDSMFVDEGFGTLDDTSLSLAIRALEGLSEGVRTVGIISHVAELQNTIEHQLIVKKHPDGTRVEIRG